MTESIQLICIAFIPLVFSITIHESMHGYVALRCGDTTALSHGRISLNPINHIDPVGTVILPLGLMLLQGLVGGPIFLFGWAKPVPVNFSALRNPKRDMLWVAAAGPASNVIMAIIWGYLAVYFPLNLGIASVFFKEMGQYGVLINISLAAINLLPLLPLDGGRIVASLLPDHLSRQYARLEPYGFAILLLLFIIGERLLNLLLAPIFIVLETIVSILIV